MISIRAGEEFYDFERLASRNKAIVVTAGRPAVKNKKLLLQCLERYGGADYYCGKRKYGPWEIVKSPRAHDKSYLVALGSQRADAHALNLDE